MLNARLDKTVARETRKNNGDYGNFSSNETPEDDRRKLRKSRNFTRKQKIKRFTFAITKKVNRRIDWR